jgi:hypothetical protein
VTLRPDQNQDLHGAAMVWLPGSELSLRYKKAVSGAALKPKRIHYLKGNLKEISLFRYCTAVFLQESVSQKFSLGFI